MDKLNKLKESLLEQNSYDKLSSFYFIFADPTRLRIIYLLIKSDLCVSDIANILEVSNSVISHQLAILKSHDIVTTKRNGKFIVYSLTDEHIKLLFETGIEHICEKNIAIASDLNKKKDKAN